MPSSLTSVPDHFPNSTRSPVFRSIGINLPFSSRPPGPTAMISPSEGFSFAVSGMMIPPALFSSASMRLTTTRSCSGRNFILSSELLRYRRNVEPGEYVSPGVPLVTLINLDDMWVHFDLREDLVRTLKIGDRFDVRIPTLSDRRITVEVKLIATKGEYASWRATRATGDFDLRTFSIRAYPVDKVPELRPGMSVYMDWQQRR